MGFEIDISNIKSELHKQFKIVGENNKSIKQCYQHITFHNKAFTNKVKGKNSSFIDNITNNTKYLQMNYSN